MSGYRYSFQATLLANRRQCLCIQQSGGIVPACAELPFLASPKHPPCARCCALFIDPRLSILSATLAQKGGEVGVDDNGVIRYRTSNCDCEMCAFKMKCCLVTPMRTKMHSKREGVKDVARAIAMADAYRKTTVENRQSARGLIANPRAYLFRIANNLMINNYRAGMQRVQRECHWRISQWRASCLTNRR